MRAVVGLAIIVVGSAAALASDIDWKFYGGAEITGISYQCFYDAAGVAKQPDTHVRVWTKCLSVKEIDSIDTEKESFKKIAESTARKLIEGYVPPIIAIKKIEFDKITDVTGSEEVANAGDIQPHSRIFYELNCSEKMLRELSISIQENNKSGTSDKPSNWRYVSPETNGATLLQILCPQQ
jgi:hypothetical protein